MMIIAYVVAGAALAGLSACSSDSGTQGPPDDGIEVRYLPAAMSVPILQGQTFPMWVVVVGDDAATYAWRRAGAVVSRDPSYTYQAADLGTDTVTVDVQAGGATYTRRWLFLVEPDPAEVPPPVVDFTVGDGPDPGDAVLLWPQEPAQRHPVVGYHVVASTDGPVTAENWGAALALGFVPVDPAGPTGLATFGEGEGLQPGARTWFAIRSEDDLGQLSACGATVLHELTYPWTITFGLFDDLGARCLDAAVSLYDGTPVEPTADGGYVLGPHRSCDAFTLLLSTPLFAPRALELTEATHGTDFALGLLHPYVLDHEACSTDVIDFLQYFRRATMTEGLGGRPTRVWRWEHYPLQVWIPRQASPVMGWDLHGLAAEALGIWNDALGEAYLVEAADSLSADIVYSFRSLSGYLGYTEVLEPGGGIGAAIPVRMRIDVALELEYAPAPDPIWVTEVSLHELGHALGHYGHVCSSGAGNLMDWSGAIGSLAGGAAGAINADEMRTVRAVRYLPQGQDAALWERP